jgi:hypothetical protein
MPASSSGDRNDSTRPWSSAITVSARRFPISGSSLRAATSRAAMARAMWAGGTANARRAFRVPIPFTVVRSSKNSRSDGLWNPIRRGVNDAPWL